MDNFVDNNSIVRKIWSNPDAVLFIFAGAAAQFSLNKAVDWLYFTGKLPNDPLGRLFSTVAYAQKIVFSSTTKANAAIDQITQIHQNVENARNSKIPDWAYRDVLFMLIDYSIRAYELLENELKQPQKDEVVNVFCRVGSRMKIKNLPNNHNEFKVIYEQDLKQNLVYGNFSEDLYKQYKKHLGLPRYFLMKKVQSILVPNHVKSLLKLGNGIGIKTLIKCYKILKMINLSEILKVLILPKAYQTQIKNIAVLT
ncbi:MAG: DUF2236 domain-containing protein [Pedobacter sp.]|nr:MAG: DUF2236 domain-containing protein [Pedobacter sp.]